VLRVAVIAFVALCAAASLAAAGVGVAAAGDGRVVALSLAWALAGLAATLASAAAARRAEQEHVRVAWLVWTFGAAIWTGGALMRLAERGDGHFLIPGTADVLWPVFAIVAIVGVAVRSARGAFSFPLYALDALPVVLLLTVFSRLGDEGTRPHGTAHNAFALAYPVLFGFLALVSAQFIALQGVRRAWARGSFAFVGAFFLLAAAAMAWVDRPAKSAGPEDVSALLWLAGFLVLAAYAVRRARAPSGAIAFYAPKRDRGTRSLPPAAALAGLALLDVLDRTDSVGRWFLLVAVIAFGARLYLARRAAGEVLDELQAERDFTGAVIETAGHLVCVIDADGRFIRFNRACEELSGYSREEFLERPFYEIVIPPEEQAEVAARVGAVHAGDFPNEGENHWVTRSGGRRLIAWKNTALLDADGSVRYVIATGIDVTEQRRAEEALSRKEERFRALLESAPDAVVIADADGRIILVNGTTERLFGYGRDELVGLHVEALLPESARSRHIRHRETYLADPRTRQMRTDMKLVARRKDGGELSVDVSLSSLETEDGTLVTAFVRDTTERKRAEEALHAAEERYRTLVEQIPIVTYLTAIDDSSKILYISPQIEAVLGYPVEEWLERPDFNLDVIHPADRASEREKFARWRAEGGVFHSEYRAIAREGRVVWLEDATVVIRDEAGKPLYAQGYLLDITARKEAEAKLREAEERYRTLVEQLPAIVYAAELGLDGQWLYVSPQVESMLGYTQEEWTSSPRFWLDSIHPDDRERVEAYESGEWALDDDFGYEYRLVAKDGRAICVRDEATIISDETGTPRWHQGFLLDITKQKEAEDGLRRAEERYRTLVEQLPAIVYTTEIGLDGKWLYVSPQIETMLGVPSGEWVGDKSTWLRHVHPDDEERVQAFEVDVLGTTGDVSLEYRLVASDGRVVWVRDNAKVVRDGTGEPRWYQGFMLDITGQRRAEQALREMTEMLESLIEASPVAIIAFDADGLLTRWNPAAERSFGWAAADVLGGPNPLVGPAEREEFQAFFARAMGGESWRDLEVTRRRRDGSKIELSVSSGPMRSADGTIVGLVSLLADVTERRLAEAERERLLAALAEQNELLLELDKLKDEFVALVSHELRTPLTSIRGYLELIMDGDAGELTAEQAEFLSVIDRNADRLLRLVGDLLFMAQLEAGAMKLEVGAVELGRLAAEAVRAATPSAEKRDIELTLDVEDGVPEVRGDRSRLAQVLDNLLSNALKFTPAGGRVTVSIAATGESVVAEVADSGMGMTPEEQGRLFQRFFRTTDATRQAIQGTGLGLAISKGIVEAHGGTISVESAKGLGTRFRIILPALQGEQSGMNNGAIEEAA